MDSKRTKIVCTIGPASKSVELIKSLVVSGMDMARVSFSHGTHADHAETIKNIKTAETLLDMRIPILQDLSGPKVRIGAFESGSVELVEASQFALMAEQIVGDATKVSVNSPEFINALSAGDQILLADGEIQLQVRSTATTHVDCVVVAGGELSSKKGITVPGIGLDVAIPTPKDIKDLLFGKELGVDWIAQSFVRNVDDVKNLKSILDQYKFDIPVIVKLEKREALDELEGIISEADGVMIARGDLGLEIPLQEVPAVQKKITKLTNDRGKPVITATQMLESMVHNPRPTRAEVTDIANAIIDGTSALMLSAETAIGKYPTASVKMMKEVALATESKIDYLESFKRQPITIGDKIPDAIVHSACHTALEIGAKLIICCTRYGDTARQVSKYRPSAKIAVVSPYEQTLRKSMLYWGTSAVTTRYIESIDQMINESKASILKAGLGYSGDRVVIVGGMPVGYSSSTNMLKADIL
ncbi:TPA: pyruvate kinase [Candidatus Poribacteria bacterium]|nr:pyruvate kinase [Candidatus Poribacteria bacterium]